VDRALKTLKLTEALMNRVEPSQKRKLHPPGCRLQKSLRA
jgi:hypothetical protein